MNCALLKDDCYVDDIKSKIIVWLAEGYKALSDKRSAGIIMSHSHGVAILIKKGVDYTLHSKIIDALGRYIIRKSKIQDKIYVVINIYAPNKDKDSFKFFADLLARLKNETLDEEENIIIGADFNCPFNTILDKKGGILIPRKSVISIKNSIQGDLHLIAIWRVKNPNTKSYTWSQNSPMILCRLDYWLISNNLHDLIT